MDSIEIKQYSITEITNELLLNLKEVFSKAYYNTHMYDDFKNDIKERPLIFQAFIAYLKNKVIGVIVVETKKHKFIDYMGFDPIHIKRFTVLPEYRSGGVGRLLLDRAKKYAFENNNFSVIFGESNEVGALSFYGREGALYSKGVIEEYSRRNSKNENIIFFKEFITNSKFRNYRFPQGHGILFVFCKDEYYENILKQKKFISKEEF